MQIDYTALLTDFDKAATHLGLSRGTAPYEHEVQRAPHNPMSLRPGFGAVYIFALASHSRSEAGPGRVLKVGRVGPNSNARFQSQHYSPGSSGSNLAKSLIRHPILWPWLGVDHVDVSNVRAWMLANLDRISIYVPAASTVILPHLETYVRARVGSVYEGAA